MTFERWNDETWKVTVRDEDHIELTVPGSVCIFNKHDFLELQHNINIIDLFEKEDWFVHDGNIINRVTGEQLIGVTEDCWKLNELTEEIKELQSFKENVEKILQEEYDTYSDKVWSTWIKNLCYKLKVILK